MLRRRREELTFLGLLLIDLDILFTEPDTWTFKCLPPAFSALPTASPTFFFLKRTSFRKVLTAAPAALTTSPFTVTFAFTLKQSTSALTSALNSVGKSFGFPPDLLLDFPLDFLPKPRLLLW